MRVALMHFPKTGGTTVHDFLKTAYNADQICPERFNNFNRFSVEELQKFDYFSAHMDFSNLCRIGKPVYTVTILREPKAQIMSLYYFWRAQSDSHIEKHKLAGPALAKKLSLLEFLNTQEHGIPANINNYYTRNLLGMNTTGQNGRLVVSDEDALRIAMRNLLTFDEIGFLDDIPSLLTRMGKLLGLEVPKKIPRARTSDNFGKDPNTEKVSREKITPEIDARLDELTRLDRVIYENARRMLLS